MIGVYPDECGVETDSTLVEPVNPAIDSVEIRSVVIVIEFGLFAQCVSSAHIEAVQIVACGHAFLDIDGFPTTIF